MNKLSLLLCTLLTLLMFPSCSNEEEEILPQITKQSFLGITENKYYQLKNGQEYLKYKKGDWYETKPEHENTNPDELVGMISRERVALFILPQNLWVKKEQIYTNYREDMDNLYIGSEDNIRKVYFPYLEEDVTKFDGYEGFIFFVKNSFLIDGNNRLTLSSDYYNNILENGYRFVIEEVNERQMIIRIEFPIKRFKCDGMRITYEVTSEIPNFYMDFETQEDVVKYIKSVIN